MIRLWHKSSYQVSHWVTKRIRAVRNKRTALSYEEIKMLFLVHGIDFLLVVLVEHSTLYFQRIGELATFQ